MDYADCIWSPHLKVDIAQLENAQRRATRLVPDLRNKCYEDRLRALNLPSLLCRRRRTDMIQTFRIMTGIDDLEDIGENINKELIKISEWLKINRLSLNATKSKFMMFKKTNKIVNSPNLNIDGTPIERI